MCNTNFLGLEGCTWIIILIAVLFYLNFCDTKSGCKKPCAHKCEPKPDCSCR